MKNFKFIATQVAVVFSLYVITSCQEEVSVPDIPRENSTKAEIVEDAISVAEGDDPTFTIRQDLLVEGIFDEGEAFDVVSGQVGIRVVGGTATEGEDYDFDISSIQDFSPFLLQDGYYYAYDASVDLETEISAIISITDDEDAEGDETIMLQFYPVGLGAIVIDDTITITITD